MNLHPVMYIQHAVRLSGYRMSRKIPREHISSRSCARMGANLGYHRCRVHGMNASRSSFGRVRSCRSSDNRVRVQQRTRLSPRRGKVMATHLGYQFFAPLPVQRVCPMTTCPMFCRWHVTQGFSPKDPFGHELWSRLGLDKAWLFFTRLLHAAQFG